jgi:hypothetical protein
MAPTSAHWDEGGELVDCHIGVEVKQRQGVVPAVPGEKGGVALPVRYVEGSVEGLDPMLAEERGAAVLQAERHA